jgi:hypothetical protein
MIHLASENVFQIVVFNGICRTEVNKKQHTCSDKTRHGEIND